VSYLHLHSVMNRLNPQTHFLQNLQDAKDTNPQDIRALLASLVDELIKDLVERSKIKLNGNH